MAIDWAVVAERLMTVPELAGKFQVAESTIWRWANEYKLTRRRKLGRGKTTFFDLNELERKTRKV